ncbi:MAG: hypothetical protein LUD69_08725, partial [Oscillospiraceae bacterium]|nr:hypothetical protein [Oscillospiraceae bacterium]
ATCCILSDSVAFTLKIDHNSGHAQIEPPYLPIHIKIGCRNRLQNENFLRQGFLRSILIVQPLSLKEMLPKLGMAVELDG